MNYIDELALDIYRRVGETGTPDEREMLLYRMYALLGHVLWNSEVTNEDVHDAWSAWTATYRPDHASLVPFTELTPEVQDLDSKYRDAIVAASRGWTATP